MKYLGKGVLRYAKKEYGYGADLPKGIDEKVLMKLAKNGLIGDLPEKIKPGKMLDDAMAENAKLSKLVEMHETESESLLKQVGDLLEENKQLLLDIQNVNGSCSKNIDEIDLLKKEISKLKKKAEKVGA